MSLKLVSINIESHKHLQNRVIPFLLAEKPDVVCLQEVFAVDVPEIMATLNMTGAFYLMANVAEVSIHQPVALGRWGLLLLTHLPIKHQQGEYYTGDPSQLPEFFANSNPNSMNRVFAWMTVEQGGQDYTIGTTHFTWSQNGDSTPEQLRDVEQLLKIIDGIPDIVFAGDFNAPRGKETFAKIAERYKDNIPPGVTTSIDGDLHKAGPLELMVDGLFSTPEYQVTDVEVVGGVSDHKAITATVSKEPTPA